jgi:formyltetrahydrofolate deformylase
MPAHVEAEATPGPALFDSSDELAAVELPPMAAQEIPSLMKVHPPNKKTKTPVYEATVLLSCPDAKGLVAKSVSFFQELGCHIFELDQHIMMNHEHMDNHNNREEEARKKKDPSAPKLLFQRLRFDYSECFLGTTDFALSSMEEAIQGWASTCLEIESTSESASVVQWSISYAHRPKRMAVFVSKQSHCLFDILLLERERREGKKSPSGGCALFEIPLIVSNHQSLAHVASQFGIPFYHVPLSTEDKEEEEDHNTATATQQMEAEMAKLLEVYGIDVVVLANYNRIISGDFCRKMERRNTSILNIYHSFLPAFGEENCPYQSAYERGVKGIGATCHYLTGSPSEGGGEDNDNDACGSLALHGGPIIEQDVVRVGHQDTVGDLMQKGRHVERSVLLRGIKWHLEDRIHVVCRNKTIVFES